MSKRHIKNYTKLNLSETVGKSGSVTERSDDLKLLLHMQRTGRDFLSHHHPEKDSKTEFLLGFHAPGHNSQHHLHMHLIVLPFVGNDPDRVAFARDTVYGELLDSVDQIIQRNTKRLV